MQRISNPARPNWQSRVEASGLSWHSGDVPYWTETAHYEFTTAEVETIESATAELHARCLDAVQHVIDKRRYAELAIPIEMVPLIEATWNDSDNMPSLYGRFDLAYDGKGGPVKMLEYNADTPTSLLEAAVTQWDWLEDTNPTLDQFNSLHERLIAAWRSFQLQPPGQDTMLHLVSVDDGEDRTTVEYLAETARQANLQCRVMQIEQIGLTGHGYFVDDQDRIITDCFKLYPWEWLAHEDYAAAMVQLGTRVRWIEPAWKMILSNKGVLPILHELFPDHPNILPASFQEIDAQMWEAYVKKPILSREGAGVTVNLLNETLAETPTSGYGEEGFVYQSLATIPIFGDQRPVLGSWIIGQEPGGMGIREDTGLVTGNRSRFVPHLIRG